MELLTSIGRKIRTFRQIKGWSQENMAHQLGMSVPGVSKIERGLSDVKISRIESIAEILGIHPSQLIDTQENTNFNNYANAVAGSFTYNKGNMNINSMEEINFLKEKISALQKRMEKIEGIKQ
ncbi:MAG: transcriptional regulator with XRE-family HTH domain [Arenicella sp.]|jgi:transcriptional regulator with XRE-family HTH domain